MAEDFVVHHRSTGERVFLYLVTGLGFGLCFGVGGVLGAVLLWRRQQLPRRVLFVLYGVSIVWVVILLARQGYALHWHYWLFTTLPLIGLAHLSLRGLLLLHEWYLHPPTWDRAVHLQHTHREHRRERRLHTRAQRLPTQHSALEIGMVVEPDVRTVRMDAVQVREHYLWAEERLLDQHLLLIGAPGSGKSEAIKRLLTEILTKTTRDVYLVDGKGELEFAHAVRHLFQRERGVTIPLFQIGASGSGDCYNGFVGTPEAIKQRLTAMFNVEQQTGDGEFYANVNRALLNLVCLAPDGPPRTLAELDERLSLSWLRLCYQHDSRKLRALERYAPYFDGFRVRADSLIWDFAPYLSPEGFSLESVPGAVFSLRTAAMGDTSRRFLNFLIEDFKDWVGKRQKRPAFLVIDEFGQFENQSVMALIELARSAKLGILLATQDLAAVQERHIRERLLSSVQTKLLMKTDTPEQVGELAGTYTTPHLTYQMDETDLTGLGSLRLEEQRKVDLNRVRRFPPGRAYLIRSGAGMIVQFRQVADAPSS